MAQFLLKFLDDSENKRHDEFAKIKTA